MPRNAKRWPGWPALAAGSGTGRSRRGKKDTTGRLGKRCRSRNFHAVSRRPAGAEDPLPLEAWHAQALQQALADLERAFVRGSSGRLGGVRRGSFIRQSRSRPRLDGTRRGCSIHDADVPLHLRSKRAAGFGAFAVTSSGARIPPPRFVRRAERRMRRAQRMLARREKRLRARRLVARIHAKTPTKGRIPAQADHWIGAQLSSDLYRGLERQGPCENQAGQIGPRCRPRRV